MEHRTEQDFKTIISFTLSNQTPEILKKELNECCGDIIPMEYFYHSNLWTVLTTTQHSAIIVHIVKQFADPNQIIVIKKV
jgi:myosin-crossreactive antigen